MTKNHQQKNLVQEDYLIPANGVTFEEKIKQSRFITVGFHCKDNEDFKRKYDLLKLQYPGANHYCYAFVLNHPKNMASFGFGDDGEPNGSAGKPMLSVLQGANIGEIAVIVIRYFGGVKLGVGGLVRAYSSGVKQALTQLNTELKRITLATQLECDYCQLQDVEYLIAQHKGEISTKIFDDKVLVQFQLAQSSLDKLNVTLANFSQGKLQARFEKQ